MDENQQMAPVEKSEVHIREMHACAISGSREDPLSGEHRLINGTQLLAEIYVA